MDQESRQSDFFDVAIDDAAQEHLKTITKWARIVAILGLGGAVLSFVEILINKSGVVGSILGGFIVLIISVVLNMLLLRFANRTAAGIEAINQGAFNEGMTNLNTYFKMMGILMIICISFVILAVLVGIMFGVGQAMR